MRLYLEATGETVEVGEAEQLAAGGEARIFLHPGDPAQVIKVWHKPSADRARKVQAMLANPPADPMAAQGHVAIAWPTGLVRLAGPLVVGFVMPRVQGVRPVIDYFNPKTRLQHSPLFNWFYLHRTARNLATAMRALHERGYVIGDLNECNILASETALVTMVDTDSFQVWDAVHGVLYRCRVGRPEFTPPELQGKSFAQINREPVHDHFGLGILIFQLLMEGTHPFAGVYRGPGEPPPLPERIAAGHFPHGGDPRVPYTPMPAAPRFEWLHPVLQNLFCRCFRDGHLQPASRPDPLSWQYGLEEAELNLVSCHDNQQHIYSNHLTACPWCERAAQLAGRDPFPSVAAVQAGEHLRPAPPPRTRLKQTSGWSLPYPGRPAAGGRLPPLPRPISSARGWTRSAPAPPRRSWRGRFRRASTGPSGGNSAADLLRQAFGAANRNDTAWSGLFLAGLSLGVRGAVAWGWMPETMRAVAQLLGLVAILLGLLGLYQSQSWQLGGVGRRPAIAAIILGGLMASL
jgi:DNA-binding helix-hairpin-helix protein with protein kinase domain